MADIIRVCEVLVDVRNRLFKRTVIDRARGVVPVTDIDHFACLQDVIHFSIRGLLAQLAFIGAFIRIEGADGRLVVNLIALLEKFEIYGVLRNRVRALRAPGFVLGALGLAALNALDGNIDNVHLLSAAGFLIG